MTTINAAALADKIADADRLCRVDFRSGAQFYFRVEFTAAERDLIVSRLRAEPAAARAAGCDVDGPEQTKPSNADNETGPYVSETNYHPQATLAELALDAGFNAGVEAAAAIVAPNNRRPCTCEWCDCHNVESALAVACWDESTANAAAIRALKRPEAGQGDAAVKDGTR